MRSMSSLSTTGLLITLLLISGCAIGPDFESPTAPNAAAYSLDGMPTATEEANIAGGNRQKFVPGADVPAEWWNLFRSEPLTQLIALALRNNPTLQAAEASLRVAEENLSAGDSAFFPTIDGAAGVTREKNSGINGSSGGSRAAFSLFNASVKVAYTPDVFGGVRREVEGLAAQTDFQRYELEAAHLTLTSNVVTAAIQEASLRTQIKATQDIIDGENKQLELLRQQFNLGGVAKSAVLAQAATLAQAQAGMPSLEKQLAQTRHQLSALVGQLPHEKLEATFDLSQLTLPEELPLTLPSQLVAQRPDIKAAEAQLHAASAYIGQVIAASLPQFSLSASYGGSSSKLADLLSPQSAVWNLGANILQPIFYGGQLAHKRAAAHADFDRAFAQYRGTVLTAFQNVADVLQALQSDALELKARLAAERAAADSMQLSRDQFQAGAISYISLLTAQQTYEQTKIALVKAQAQRYADTAALFQALGGGWWNRQTVADAKNSPTE